jgi:hypothetical protein
VYAYDAIWIGRIEPEAAEPERAIRRGLGRCIAAHRPVETLLKFVKPGQPGLEAQPCRTQAAMQVGIFQNGFGQRRAVQHRHPLGKQQLD